MKMKTAIPIIERGFSLSQTRPSWWNKAISYKNVGNTAEQPGDWKVLSSTTAVAFQHPFVVLSFCYLIKHKDKLTSHCIDVVADDNDHDDGVRVLFFFHHTAALFLIMVSPFQAFRLTPSFLHIPTISPCREVTKHDTNIGIPLLISRHISEIFV
jgi:hypothetical protein